MLLQIFEDIFVQLENENHLILSNNVMYEDNRITSTISLIININNSNINENENDKINDNDVLVSLNDLITHVVDHDTIFNKNIEEKNEIASGKNSVDTIDTIDIAQYQQINGDVTWSSSSCVPINRPPCIKIPVPGVIFITDRELRFIDEQRASTKDNFWLPNDSVGNSKPSRTWFTETRKTWLRAVYSEKKYGLLCIVCAQEAACNLRLIRNRGAFISHPYWKLYRKGVAGIINN